MSQNVSSDIAGEAGRDKAGSLRNAIHQRLANLKGETIRD